jgi:hypothetical protein
MKAIKSIVLGAAVFGPLAVLAHEGHGHENPLSPGHYLANPEHAIPLALALAVVVFFIGRKIFHARTKKEERK